MSIAKIIMPKLITGVKTLLRSPVETCIASGGGSILKSGQKLATDTFERAIPKALDTPAAGISAQMKELKEIIAKPKISEAVSRDISFEVDSIDQLRQGINGVKINSTKASNLKHKGQATIFGDESTTEIVKNGNKYTVYVKYKDVVNPDTICTNEEFQSIKSYVFQRRFRDINKGLEAIHRGESVDKEIFEDIKNIGSTIRKFGEHTEKLHVHRWEDTLWSLDKLETSFGKNLNKKMYEVIEKFKKFDTLSKKEKEELVKLKNRIIEEINAIDKQDIVQPHFMSTSFSTELPKINQNNVIRFDLEVSPKVKGLDIVSFLKDEVEHISELETLRLDRELLIQTYSKIKLGKIDFDEKKCLWIINGKVTA